MQRRYPLIVENVALFVVGIIGSIVGLLILQALGIITIGGHCGA